MPRFRLRTLMALPVIAGVALFLLGSYPQSYWVYPATIPLDFLVIDDQSGAVIQSAAVHLFWTDPARPTYTATTGLDGRVALAPTFLVSGTRYLFRDTTGVEYFYYASVSASGYQTYETELLEFARAPASGPE